VTADGWFDCRQRLVDCYTQTHRQTDKYTHTRRQRERERERESANKQLTSANRTAALTVPRATKFGAVYQSINQSINRLIQTMKIHKQQ